MQIQTLRQAGDPAIVSLLPTSDSTITPIPLICQATCKLPHAQWCQDITIGLYCALTIRNITTFCVVIKANDDINRSAFHTEILAMPHCVPDVVPDRPGAPSRLLCYPDFVPSSQTCGNAI